jgi:hypothetical protein
MIYGQPLMTFGGGYYASQFHLLSAASRGGRAGPWGVTPRKYCGLVLIFVNMPDLDMLRP